MYKACTSDIYISIYKMEYQTNLESPWILCRDPAMLHTVVDPKAVAIHMSIYIYMYSAHYIYICI